MVYWDGQRYVSRTPTVIPDIRIHLENWREFNKVTRSWPVLSIAAYAMRFVIMIGGVVFALWYAIHHDLTKGQGALIGLVVSLPALFGWFLVERAAWNHNLRQRGISSPQEIWSVTQFPQK